ncbi:MAG: SDR family oxidoreductase, partial [Cytophagales bacterium]|nr:SDR family oxidoreductase [Cytophagales bacterium]
GAAAHGPVEEVLRQWGASHPIGRIGTPAEVAEAVLFLWTSGFIAGQSLVIDGGLISKIL